MKTSFSRSTVTSNTRKSLTETEAQHWTLHQSTVNTEKKHLAHVYVHKLKALLFFYKLANFRFILHKNILKILATHSSDSLPVRPPGVASSDSVVIHKNTTHIDIRIISQWLGIRLRPVL